MMVNRKKKPRITEDMILHRDPDQEFTYIDGEIVMLSLKNGEYYGMDNVGTRIWELLENPGRISDIVDRLFDEFDVDRDECEADTREYLDMLCKKKLLKVSG